MPTEPTSAASPTTPNAATTLAGTRTANGSRSLASVPGTAISTCPRWSRDVCRRVPSALLRVFPNARARALNWLQWILRIALGRRLPTTDGTLSLPELRQSITIRRDSWGIPYIQAETDYDAWFGLGFCHGQDRAFQ